MHAVNVCARAPAETSALHSRHERAHARTTLIISCMLAGLFDGVCPPACSQLRCSSCDVCIVAQDVHDALAAAMRCVTHKLTDGHATDMLQTDSLTVRTLSCTSIIGMLMIPRDERAHISSTVVSLALAPRAVTSG
jgi:hypothetical protein